MVMRHKKPLKPLVDSLKGSDAKPGALQRIYNELGLSTEAPLAEVIRRTAEQLRLGNVNLKVSDMSVLCQGLNKKKYTLG